MLHPGRGRRHAVLILVGVAAMLAALWAGLIRIGWPLPFRSSGLPAAHGPLMTMGFLGLLIGLERAFLGNTIASLRARGA